MYNLSTTTTTTSTSTTNGISTLFNLEMYTYSFMFLNYHPNLETQTSLAIRLVPVYAIANLGAVLDYTDTYQTSNVLHKLVIA